jgi:CRISPR type III-A-associated RAMP protein Csm4
MKIIILRSRPGTRFHFGKALGAYTEELHNTQKTTSDYLHSDTLWSALVNSWALSCPETVEDFIAQCINENFKLSSAFYCLNKSLFFLPKPLSLNLFKVTDPKRMKNIRFISKGIWENGIMPDDWFESDKCTLLQNEKVVALKSEISEKINLFSIETNAKTSARNIKVLEDSFYFQTDLTLGNSVQWYFFIDNQMPIHLHTDFHLAMDTLVNLGIGGERTTGCGSLYGFEEHDFDFNFNNSTLVEESNQCVSISLVSPIENELSETSLYQAIKRGGRFYEKGKSLPMIQMLLEGAVLDNELKGRIIKLNDQPKIMRYGLNFPVPLHSNFQTTNLLNK